MTAMQAYHQHAELDIVHAGIQQYNMASLLACLSP